ncbi:3-deoxy-7-phosphoheptulonate synthase [soil metagenome]
MVIVMERAASEASIAAVVNLLRGRGLEVHRSLHTPQVVLGATGAGPDFDLRSIKLFDGVADAYRVSSPYKLASREWRRGDTIIDLGSDLEVGSDEFVIIAGPCSVESEEQIESTAAFVAGEGATILRGGAYKPRSSPYAFQGLKEEGLVMLRQAADKYGLRVVTEVTAVSQVDLVAQYADILQVGARNMQNFVLLHELGLLGKPVFLKRGMSATVEEWLMSAEYILAAGNPHVILCERGIRTFETATRNTLDLSAVAIVKEKSHLPVFVDPSHGVGIRDKVLPLARAAAAVGADGLMIEVHPDPPSALSDGPQSLYFADFAELVQSVRDVAAVVGRTVREPRSFVVS